MSPRLLTLMKQSAIMSVKSGKSWNRPMAMIVSRQSGESDIGLNIIKMTNKFLWSVEKDVIQA